MPVCESRELGPPVNAITDVIGTWRGPITGSWLDFRADGTFTRYQISLEESGGTFTSVQGSWDYDQGSLIIDDPEAGHFELPVASEVTPDGNDALQLHGTDE